MTNKLTAIVAATSLALSTLALSALTTLAASAQPEEEEADPITEPNVKTLGVAPAEAMGETYGDIDENGPVVEDEDEDGDG